MRHGTPGGMYAQMTLDGQRIMMGQGSKEWGTLSPRETKSATQGIGPGVGPALRRLAHCQSTYFAGNSMLSSTFGVGAPIRCRNTDRGTRPTNAIGACFERA